MLSLAGLNVWALLVTTFLGFVLGGVWYSPLAFGRRWLAAIGKTERELGSPLRPMLITFLSSFLTSMLLATLIRGLGFRTWGAGFTLGLLVSLGFVVSAMASDFAFCRWSLRLFAILAGYRVVYGGLAGGFLAAWQ